MLSRKKSAWMLGAGLLAAQTLAHAGQTYRVQPASGHPLDNLARSNFDIFDQMVTNHSSTARTWITHFQRPTGLYYGVPSDITGYVNATSGSRHRLCKFSTVWLGCTSWVTAASTHTAITSTLSLYGHHTVHLQSSLKDGQTLTAVMFDDEL